MSPIDLDTQDPTDATRIQIQDMWDSKDDSARVYESLIDQDSQDPAADRKDGRVQGTPSNQLKC